MAKEEQKELSDPINSGKITNEYLNIRAIKESEYVESLVLNIYKSNNSTWKILVKTHNNYFEIIMTDGSCRRSIREKTIFAFFELFGGPVEEGDKIQLSFDLDGRWVGKNSDKPFRFKHVEYPQFRDSDVSDKIKKYRTWKEYTNDVDKNEHRDPWIKTVDNIEPIGDKKMKLEVDTQGQKLEWILDISPSSPHFSELYDLIEFSGGGFPLNIDGREVVIMHNSDLPYHIDGIKLDSTGEWCLVNPDEYYREDGMLIKSEIEKAYEKLIPNVAILGSLLLTQSSAYIYSDSRLLTMTTIFMIPFYSFCCYYAFKYKPTQRLKPLL